MPELRQNRFTKEWVIIATDRARRPEELQVKRPPRQIPGFVPTCPFCPGNEQMTPPEINRTPSRGLGLPWLTRTVPNKFPALARDVVPHWSAEGGHRNINGFGVHDVIIETPDHSLTMARMSEAHMATILRGYLSRYLELSQDQRVAHITIFKNHGVDAGTSLEHPHSQIIAAPVISTQVRSRMQEAIRQFDDSGECIFCLALREELQCGSRIILASEHFVALEPYASPTPFCTHIYPRRHMASFDFIDEAEIADLAIILRVVLAKIYFGLNDPDFNYTIRTAPHECATVSYYHWYLSIIPRLTHVAGFELGSGMFINTVLPEAAAEFLRNIKIDKGEQTAAD
jgi:UDPglucose--hexose-1-phosphate uridylyltransferase